MIYNLSEMLICQAFWQVILAICCREVVCKWPQYGQKQTRFRPDGGSLWKTARRDVVSGLFWGLYRGAYEWVWDSKDFWYVFPDKSGFLLGKSGHKRLYNWSENGLWLVSVWPYCDRFLFSWMLWYRSIHCMTVFIQIWEMPQLCGFRRNRYLKNGLMGWILKCEMKTYYNLCFYLFYFPW